MSTLSTDLAAVEGTLEESNVFDYGINWNGPSRMTLFWKDRIVL